MSEPKNFMRSEFVGEDEKPEEELVEVMGDIRDTVKKIAGQLEELSEREPEPAPSIPAPQVTVKPPEVTVNIPETKRPKKWKFALTKDRQGRTTEIVATAVE